MKIFILFLKCGYLLIAAWIFINFLAPHSSRSWPLEILLAYLLLLSCPLGGLWLIIVYIIGISLVTIGNGIAHYYGFKFDDSIFYDWLSLFLYLMTIPIGYWQWFVWVPTYFKSVFSKNK